MARRSRRLLFRQRKSLGRRLGTGFGVALAAGTAVVGLVYVTLPWTSGLALRVFLNHSGWGPATAHVTRFDAQGIELRDVVLGGRAVSLAHLQITYRPRDLLHGRVNDIAVGGLTVIARWTDGGFAIGPLRLAQAGSPSPSVPTPARPGPATPMVPFHHLVIRDTKLVFDLPKNPVTANVVLDVTPANDRWEGQFSVEADARQDDAITRLFRVGWQGVFAPAEPENWPSKGAADFSAAAFPLSDSDAKVSAGGHLDFVTGDGRISVTAPDRIAITISALTGSIVSGLPESWAARLANGAALYAAGSKGGPVFTWRNDDGVSTRQADLDLGVNAGDTSLHATLRGKVTGAVGDPPENVAIDEMRLETNRIPLPIGEFSGHFSVSDVTGPLVLAEGKVHADVTITKPVLGPVSATSLALAGDGQIRLDGTTIALTPGSLSVTAVDVTTPALALPGPTTLALADPQGQAQTLAAVFGGSDNVTYTFGLSAAARNARVVPTSRDGTMPEGLVLDLPRLRLDGYVVPATGLYDIGLHSTEGLIGHRIADLQITQFIARFLPGGGTGTGKVQLVRLLGDAQHSTRTVGGFNLKYDFNLSDYLIDLSSSIYSSKAQLLGGMTGRLNLIDQSGHFTLDTPDLTFGDGAVAAQDVFTEGFPVSNLAGTAAISLKADWGSTPSTSSGRITLNNIAFQAPSFSLSGLNMNLDLNSLWPPKASGTPRVLATSLTAGLPFRYLTFSASLPGDGTIVLTNGNAGVAGGRASAVNITIPLVDTQTTASPITLTHVSIDALGAQAHIEDLSASGNVSGVLPLRIANSKVWVDGGCLKSDGPGHVSYRPATPPAALAGSGEPALSALDNFDYNSIIASINGDLLGQPRIWLGIKGRNPDLHDGATTSLELTFGGSAGNATRQGGQPHHGGPKASTEAEQLN